MTAGPAGWTDDGGAGRKSTGSPFFKHRNHVLSSSYTTRRDERLKTELETKREERKAGRGGDDGILKGLITTARVEEEGLGGRG